MLLAAEFDFTILLLRLVSKISYRASNTYFNCVGGLGGGDGQAFLPAGSVERLQPAPALASRRGPTDSRIRRDKER